MKKRTLKILFGFVGAIFATALISSCTASFCSDIDKARMMYPYDRGVTCYYDEKVENAVSLKSVGYDKLYYVADINNSTKLAAITTTAKSKNFNIPSIEYWKSIDQKVLDTAYGQYAEWDQNHVEKKDVTTDILNNQILKKYGYLKFYGPSKDSKLWINYDAWNVELKNTLGLENVPNSDFNNLYKTELNNTISNSRSCIATVGGEYGSYGDKDENKVAVTIEAKDWGYAWSKGPIEGLLVYPVAYLVDTFAQGFGFTNDPNMEAWPQIWSIVCVTLIVRGLLMLVSFKSTLGQQKMTQLQPELSKIQAKYPNSNTNQAQKQRLAQEQMALYKKNKINPISSLLVMLVQFPIFIGVWGAMTGSAVLSTGSLLGLDLSSGLGTVLLNYAANGGFLANNGGWWTAVVLFILMALFQFLSMKLPTFIQKYQNRNATKLSKNPAQDKQSKTMKWVSNIMLIMIIVMGFTLPSAMGVYWLVGAIISILQTVVMQLIMYYKNKAKKYGSKRR